ncbi:hypothetical protein PENTCL1PPCAC_1177, partial [Pristionchus entomophagus]
AQQDGDITSKLFTDYINVALQITFILIGLPVNISTLVYIFHKYRHARSFLLLLHINLNITDILVLAVYSTGYVGWLITYEWRAGDFMCKLLRFSDVLIFSASSNIMVCIAVYRLCALRSPLWVSAVGHSRVPRIVLSAWAVAFFIAAPQLFFWRTSTHEFELDGENATATQCVSIWTATIAENGNVTDGEYTFMMGYNMSQILLMFYIPLAIVATCYVLILRDIYSTLNVECDESSALYASEITKLSSCGKRRSQTRSTTDSEGVILHQRALRGQDKFQRAKVRSLRITLLLILTYIITWLPYNLLSWLMMLQFELYREYEDVLFFLHNLVVLNSVINPFIYGRCQGLKLILRCGVARAHVRKGEKKKQPIECCL